MEEQKKNDVETCITSVLTSNPLRMTIRDLEKQFKDMVGYAIPYREFGHMTLESYLRSIPHRLMVKGTGCNAELRVVISDKSAHMDELICRQRVAPTKKSARSGLRKNVTIRDKHQQPEKKGRKPECNPVSKGPPQNHTSLSPANSTLAKSVSSPTPLPHLSSFSPKAKPVPNSHTEGNYYTTVHSPQSSMPQTSKNRHSGVIPKSSKQSPVPNYIKNRLKQIIKDHPEGLHCNKLPDLYKNQFGQDFNFFDYGYKSVAHLCIDLSSIFTHQRLSDSSVKVFDKDLNVEVHHEPFQDVKMVWNSPSRNTESALPDGVEDILLDFHLKYLTEDVVTDVRIIRQWIGAKVGIKDYIDIVVAEVYDPSKFWIQLREHSNALNELMDRMQIFYRNKKGVYNVPYYAIKDEMYVACIFDGEYHRAKVIDDTKKKDGTLKVYYIDYGTVAVIRAHGICYLVQDFVKLPAQAIRARLWGIQPTVRNSPWPLAASSKFLDMISNKALIGQVYAVDEEDMILDLIISDTTNPDRDIFINDVLVHEGLAAFADEETKDPISWECKPTVDDVYLYPSHEEFETGAVPTYQAMLHILASNFSYDKIFPRYFQKVENNEDCCADEVDVGDENKMMNKGEETEEIEKSETSLETSVEEVTQVATAKTYLRPPRLEISVEEVTQVATTKTYLRPPPGIHYIPETVPQQDNVSNFLTVYPPAVTTVLANSMYCANMILNQALLNSMYMDNPYNQCYPPALENSTFPYNTNTFLMQPTNSRMYDPIFQPMPAAQNNFQQYQAPQSNFQQYQAPQNNFQHQTPQKYHQQVSPEIQYLPLHQNSSNFPYTMQQNSNNMQQPINSNTLSPEQLPTTTQNFNFTLYPSTSQPNECCDERTLNNSKSLENFQHIRNNLRSLEEQFEMLKCAERLEETSGIQNNFAGSKKFESEQQSGSIQNEGVIENENITFEFQDNLMDKNLAFLRANIQHKNDIENNTNKKQEKLNEEQYSLSVAERVTPILHDLSTLDRPMLMNETVADSNSATFNTMNNDAEDEDLHLSSKNQDNHPIDSQQKNIDGKLEALSNTNVIYTEVKESKDDSDYHTSTEDHRNVNSASCTSPDSEMENRDFNVSTVPIESQIKKSDVIKESKGSSYFMEDEGNTVTHLDLETRFNEQNSITESINIGENRNKHWVCSESIDGNDIHIITLNNEKKYIIVREIAQILLDSFCMLSIRRKVATSQYLIDIDNLMINEIPNLKKELILNNLVSETECKIDVVPVNHSPMLIKVLSHNSTNQQCDKLLAALNRFC